MGNTRKRQRLSKYANKIDLPFDEAVRRLLQAKPKARRKKPTEKPKG
jgi:hypothetical protein